jgi:3-methyladenine DNA glycosylase AlkD
VHSDLLTRLRAALREVADPSKAPQMQAYMKSTMPYHGVPAPALRVVCKRVFTDLELPSADTWQREALAIWRGARFREERYAAIELTAACAGPIASRRSTSSRCTRR